MCSVARLDLRLADARLREGQRVFRQLATSGRFLHSHEELQPEIRRLPEHVDEHEPVGSGITDSRPAGNAFPFEDGPRIGEHRGVPAIVV